MVEYEKLTLEEVEEINDRVSKDSGDRDLYVKEETASFIKSLNRLIKRKAERGYHTVSMEYGTYTYRDYSDEYVEWERYKGASDLIREEIMTHFRELGFTVTVNTSDKIITVGWGK